MSLGASPLKEAWLIARLYNCMPQVCPCMQVFTVEIDQRRVQVMSNGYVLMTGRIKRDGVSSHTNFANMDFDLKRCAHDQDVQVTVKVSMNQWTHVVSKSESFIAVHAIWQDGVIDTTVKSSGVLASPSARKENPDQTAYSTFELFSGGFSGWAHVLRRLSEMGHNFCHRLAIDFDPICAETYCRSHGFADAVGPENLEWNADSLPEHLFVEGDVVDSRWYHLLSDELYDFAMMSPPCPAWSAATSCPGLEKFEGRLTLYAWALMNLVRPRVVCMEMVGNMRRHQHWSIIRMMVQWAGYSIRFAPVLNLAEFTPQHRERLILIATLDSEDLQPHICQAWPATQKQTMETFLNVMRLEEPWKSQTEIDKIDLQTYLDPNYLPKSGNGNQQMSKKTRRDVEAYRIRHVQGIFGCIMASYGSGHELPEQNLRRFGLYGTLLAQANGLRFLAIPEIAIAHSALMPFWLPMDKKIATRILGNAIAIPHALVGVMNAMAFLSGMTGVEIQEIMLEAMTKRFTAQNIQWEFKWGGVSFTKDEEVCQPTQLMHSHQKITLLSPTDRFTFLAEKGTQVWDAIRNLTGPSIPQEVFLLPAGLMEAKITLPHNFEVTDQEITLFAAVPSILGTGMERFALGSHSSSCIAVFTVDNIFVLRRDQGMTVSDVITILNHHLGYRCSHLVGMLGEKHQEQTLCPDAVIARDRETVSNNLQVLEYVTPKIQDGVLTFSSSHDALKDFTEVMQDCGLLEMLPALGWIFVTDSESFIQGRAEKIMLIRRPSTLAITSNEAIFSVAVYLFLCKIKSWHSAGTNPTIRCRIKLWHVWVWDAMIDKDVTMSHFSEEWDKICSLFDLDKPWRFIVGNRSLNPLWPLGSFAEDDGAGTTSITVFMQLGLKGGGPVQLRTSTQVSNQGNLRNLAEFEKANFKAALGFVLQKVVDHRGTIARCDITTFLDLEAKALEGYYVIKGRFETLRQFMHTLRETGVENALTECGWMVTCHFQKIYDPIKAEIILFRKPLATAVSAEFVRAMLRSSLVRIGMPRPVMPGTSSVLTKVKLWGTVIFHDHLDRNTQMQDFIDIWEQASTIVCDMVPIRLVGSAGYINPDFPLRHFTKCNERDQTVATFSYMVGIHGGGYTDKTPNNAQEYTVQQRNALATFLISQGADIQGCVKFIESVLHGAGPGAVAAILGQKQPAKRWEGLIQLASAMQIQVPDIITRVSRTKNKVQNRIQQQARQLPMDIPVEALALQPGFLFNEDGTDCCQIQKVTPNSTGVVLMSEDHALPWLQDRPVISQDEMALLVIGSKGACDEFDGQRIQIPVKYVDEPLIVQATLFNLGAKKASVPQTDFESIPVTDSHVVSITAYSDEIHAETWNMILQYPVKNIMKKLLPEQQDFSFLSSPWGRSYQKAGKKVDAKNATSIQFHARVAKSGLRTILRASGNSGIYTTPKSEDRQILADYQVVWMQQTDVELAVSLSKCDNHYGVVRSQKGEGKNRGIRFAKMDYAAAFAILKPDSPAPSLVVPNFLFKVAPTPLGTTQEQIQTWIGVQGWDAKPIRALSSTVWLCGAETKFEDIFVQWNDSPVLIRWITQKKGVLHQLC